jgi:hypothetical protein
LIVARGADLSVENNDDFDAAQVVASSGAASGQRMLGALTSRSQTLIVDAFDSGWYNEIGGNDPASTDYFTGFLPPSLGYVGEYRSFFAFDLGGLSTSDVIVGAQFNVFTSEIYMSQGVETLKISDVTMPVDTIVAGGPERVDVFTDLGSGPVYGTRDVWAFEYFSVINIDLNASATAAINAAKGQYFAIGAAVSTIDVNDGFQAMFGYSGNPANSRQLVLSLAEMDFYQVSVDGTSSLKIETSTPSSGAGEFANNLDPMIRVYDVDRRLVASDDNGATDGRNAKLVLDLLPKGTYFIEVVGAGAGVSTGEYVLSVQQTPSSAPRITADGEAESLAVSRIVSPDVEHPWCNRIQPADVSNDGSVSPLDALMIINSLNADGSRSLPRGQANQAGRPFYDVNRDDFVSPIDALQVINHLSNPDSGQIVVEVLPASEPAKVPAAPVQKQVVAPQYRIPVTKMPTHSPALPYAAVRSPLADMLPPAGKAKLDSQELPPAGDAKLAAHIWGDPNQDWLFENRDLAMKSWAGDVAAAWPGEKNWHDLMFQPGRRRPFDGDR